VEDDSGLTLSLGLPSADVSSVESTNGGPILQDLDELLAPLVLPEAQPNFNADFDLNQPIEQLQVGDFNILEAPLLPAVEDINLVAVNPPHPEIEMPMQETLLHQNNYIAPVPGPKNMESSQAETYAAAVLAIAAEEAIAASVETAIAMVPMIAAEEAPPPTPPADKDLSSALPEPLATAEGTATATQRVSPSSVNPVAEENSSSAGNSMEAPPGFPFPIFNASFSAKDIQLPTTISSGKEEEFLSKEGLELWSSHFALLPQQIKLFRYLLNGANLSHLLC
jgi:hypothetical protein